MRTIESHKVNGCNEAIDLLVMDEPGSGGANHEYAIRVNLDRDKSLHQTTMVNFQNGPINEVGTNGVTNEVLLAIVIDRLQSFQKGPYACRENALALTKLEEAQHWFHHRTRGRLSRGVEGTHEV